MLALKDRFVRLIKNSRLPEDRKSPAYNTAIRQLHAAILGVCALIDSYPYTIERWMPELLTNVLAEHTYDPVRPLSCKLCIVSKLIIPPDPDLYDCEEVREHFQEDASRYLARRFQEVYRRTTSRAIHPALWLVILYVPSSPSISFDLQLCILTHSPCART